MDWIEQLFGISPDAGSGTLEALVAGTIVAVILGVALTMRAKGLRDREAKLARGQRVGAPPDQHPEPEPEDRPADRAGDPALGSSTTTIPFASASTRAMLPMLATTVAPLANVPTSVAKNAHASPLRRSKKYAAIVATIARTR
jgi:hypothetical protein